MPTDSVGVFEALGDPGRRHILELLAAGDLPAGEIAAQLRTVRGISQPATSQHLKALHAAGLVSWRPDGRRRLYAVEPAGFTAAQEWLSRFADPFAQPLDALETELVRGRRQRRAEGAEHSERGTA